MAAVLAGGLIVIWLALSGTRGGLATLGARLHWPVGAIVPLLLAALESVVFLLAVPVGDLLPEAQRWPAAWTLVALAWVVNGGAVVRLRSDA